MLESMKRLFEVEKKKGFEEGRMAGITEGEEKGRTEGKVEGLNEGTLQNLRSLTETLKLTTEEAMDALQVPLDKRAYYLEKLVN